MVSQIIIVCLDFHYIHFFNKILNKDWKINGFQLCRHCFLNNCFGLKNIFWEKICSHSLFCLCLNISLLSVKKENFRSHRKFTVAN